MNNQISNISTIRRNNLMFDDVMKCPIFLRTVNDLISECNINDTDLIFTNPKLGFFMYSFCGV